MKIKTFRIHFDPMRCGRDEQEVNTFLAQIDKPRISTSILPGRDCWDIAILYDDNIPVRQDVDEQERILVDQNYNLNADEQERYDTLQKWRNECASGGNVPHYMAVSNGELLSIAVNPVAKIEDLVKIKGFGEKKIARYGEEIIALLNSL